MMTVGRPATEMVSGCPPLRDRNTRAPYFSFFSVSNMWEYLAGQQFHALARQLVRQRAHLTPRHDHAAAQFLAVLVDLLPHRLRTADDGEDPLLNLCPGLL